MSVPDPQRYPDWLRWGADIVRVLNPFIAEVRAAYTIQGTAHQMPTYTVSTLPAADLPCRWIYVSDETGGATPAFNDGTNWRRPSDRAVVS